MSPREPSGFSIRDPIHGFVRLDDVEARLLGSLAVQRMRSIRQLGLTHLVYPGAEHSRFSHALGAMHLAGRMYDALASSGDGLLETDPRAPLRRSVRCAALLHDIGHAPFSHSAEELFEQGIDHEEMTRRLLHHGEIADCLGDDDHLDLETIETLLNGTGEGAVRLLSQIVSGELDADKMDYLLRDSLYCGVRYGNFDLERILETILPVRDPETSHWGLGLEEGGVHAFEALVLARYYMFTQVYFNVTGKVLELHLGEWLRSQQIRWPTEPSKFLELDDVSILSAMRRTDERHARALLGRDHFRLAHETREHLSADQKRAFEARLEPLRDEFGASRLLVSNSEKDPHRLDRSRLLVRSRDGRVEPMEEASHFIRHLERIDRYRVYCEEAIVEDVSRALSSPTS